MSVLNLAWLVPLFPLLACIAIIVFGHRERRLSQRLAIGGIAVAFALSQVVYWAAVTLPVGGGERAFESPPVHWLAVGVQRVTLGVAIDPVATVMLFAIPLICLLVSIYSAGYMNGDPRYSRYLAYLSLLTASALGLVVFDNLLALFIFWGIIDACSYLLTGLWHERKSAVQAGLKAFLTTQVGTLCLMLGLALIYAEVGSLAYRDVFDTETLARLADTRFLGTQFSTATAIALLLFAGAVGKSAQFPLHGWLLDAADAPTPALALIHAVTTVPAGVFLILRAYPLFTASVAGVEMPTLITIGALSVILSSVVAVAQNDIRRVIACSTIGQVGYMIAALGLGAYAGGAFHLITHAFSKALLFLSAGSVVRGMERGSQDPGASSSEHTDQEFDPSDMMHMGGLARRMPRTFWSFVIGGLALCGFPLVTAGFWSESEILAQAYRQSPMVLWILAGAGGATAFYTMRQICLVFQGGPRTRAAQHASESSPSMTIPMVILSLFAVGLGWVGISEDFPIIGGSIPDWFHRFVGSTMETGLTAGQAAAMARHAIGTVSGSVWQPLAIGSVFTIAGLALGWLVYGQRPVQSGEKDLLETVMKMMWMGWLYDCLRHCFYLNRVYQATFVRGSIWLADLLRELDRRGGDGMVNLVGDVVRGLSHVSNQFDTHVVSMLVSLAGRAGRRVSEIGAAFDLRVVDRLVNLIGLGTRSLSELSAAADVKVVDGAVESVRITTLASERFFRPVQTGKVQDYLLQASLMVLTLVAVSLIMILFLQI